MRLLHKVCSFVIFVKEGNSMHIAIEACEIPHKVTSKLRNKSLSLFRLEKI